MLSSLNSNIKNAISSDETDDDNIQLQIDNFSGSEEDKKKLQSDLNLRKLLKKYDIRNYVFFNEKYQTDEGRNMLLQAINRAEKDYTTKILNEFLVRVWRHHANPNMEPLRDLLEDINLSDLDEEKKNYLNNEIRNPSKFQPFNEDDVKFKNYSLLKKDRKKLPEIINAKKPDSGLLVDPDDEYAAKVARNLAARKMKMKENNDEKTMDLEEIKKIIDEQRRRTKENRQEYLSFKWNNQDDDDSLFEEGIITDSPFLYNEITNKYEKNPNYICKPDDYEKEFIYLPDKSKAHHPCYKTLKLPPINLKGKGGRKRKTQKRKRRKTQKRRKSKK
jgi:hypothetical protein